MIAQSYFALRCCFFKLKETISYFEIRIKFDNLFF